ncbi:MAG TPA: dipeptide epimerase [Steroidobacter sp.]
MRGLHLDVERWPLRRPLRIAGYIMDRASVVVATVTENDHAGRGEAAGVYYLEDDVDRIVARIETVRALIEAGLDRRSLQHVLPPGGARNALDCALWELEAKLSGQTLWRLAGIDQPKPLLTTFTCGADEPEVAAATAVAYTGAKAIKLKMTGEPADGDRVRAVRDARPDVWLSVDANQAFTPQSLEQLLPVLVEAGVAMIEQPFRMGAEALLDDFDSPIPIAADESLQGAADLPKLVDRFEVVNIKLDKCGGLTEGLEIARAARLLGLKPMVGCMPGTSLCIAPAIVLGQLCEIVDLDAPLFLASDREVTVEYAGGSVSLPEHLWGANACR